MVRALLLRLARTAHPRIAYSPSRCTPPSASSRYASRSTDSDSHGAPHAKTIRFRSRFFARLFQRPQRCAGTHSGVQYVHRRCSFRPQNFLALCASGYYDNTIWHRNIKGFMIQGGDPGGTGKGGQSIWGKPFADEIRSTLKVRCARRSEAQPNSPAVQQQGYPRHGQFWARHKQIPVLRYIRQATPSRWQIYDLWQGLFI